MKDAKIVPPYKDEKDLHEWQKWAEKTRRKKSTKKTHFPKKC
jgi:hypothetical protein